MSAPKSGRHSRKCWSDARVTAKNSRMATQLVLLDFDGTLVDTAPDLIRATNRFLKSKNRYELPEKTIRDQIGFGLFNLVQKTFPDALGDAKAMQELQSQFLATYEEEILRTPTFFPGAFQFLQTWPGKFAIVSNKRVRLIEKILKHMQIDTLPWVAIIGGDSYPQMKPHPLPFIEAMKKAGIERANTVMVGDGEPDIEGALAVGIPSVAVSFGYSPIERLVQLGAGATIDDFAELPSVLEKLCGPV